MLFIFTSMGIVQQLCYHNICIGFFTNSKSVCKSAYPVYSAWMLFIWLWLMYTILPDTFSCTPARYWCRFSSFLKYV